MFEFAFLFLPFRFPLLMLFLGLKLIYLGMIFLSGLIKTAFFLVVKFDGVIPPLLQLLVLRLLMNPFISGKKT